MTNLSNFLIIIVILCFLQIISSELVTNKRCKKNEVNCDGACCPPNKKCTGSSKGNRKCK